MHLALLLILLTSTKSVEVKFVDTAPKIDGVIEEIWQTADSAYDFVQFAPYEKQPPSEKTIVYVLQDKDNLYVAFRCWADSLKPIACLTGNEEQVIVAIDPFGSKTTAYYFSVFGSNIPWDGWVLDDGRVKDDSWEGVWFRGVRLYDDRWEAEFKIPFKSIRYRQGLTQWGATFSRYIARNHETSLWNEFTQIEGDLVSKYGTLTNMNPQSGGHYFEIYPEGLVRYDRYEGFTDEVKPRASLNLKWDVTPQTTLNATGFPDFAQIESDPFTVNLSRYPTYLSERRPFFVEGKDIFRMAEFGEGKGFFSPLNVFYSRRIGKSMNGDAVPIIGGLKLTSKSNRFDFGVLGAYTDAYVQDDSILLEPRRLFGVARAKYKVMGNSDVGLLFSGTRGEHDDYNAALGLDGAFRKGANQLIVQAAGSVHNEKTGWGTAVGYFGLNKGLLTIGSAEVINDSFDVGQIGFVPWAGRKRILIFAGPLKQYPRGSLQSLFIAPGILVTQEPGSRDWSKLVGFEINPGFRKQWGFDLSGFFGPYYEADTNYLHKEGSLSGWGNVGGNHMELGTSVSYDYNYRRGFLAWSNQAWFSYRYSLIPNVGAAINLSEWIEHDTSDQLIAITTLVRPRIDIRFNAAMTLSPFTELAFETPRTEFGNTELLSNRNGLLFQWNFRPKSWFYVALNDYREQDTNGNLTHQYLIGALKAKYLLYF